MHCLSAAVARPLLQAFAALAIATPALAAEDSQLWTGGIVTAKLSDHWRLSEEITARFSHKRNGLYEIENNILLGYSVAKGITLWAGYTHDPNYSAGHFTIMEHRAREQVTFDNLAKLGPGRLSGRLRFEERWRGGLAGTGWRVRPYVKYTLPLHKGRRTAFVLSTEPFIDLNTTVFQRTPGLDRVRTFVGLATPLAKNMMIEIGYLNQHTFVRAGADSDDHIASASLSLSL
jgi:hypothetical protein